MIEKNKKCIVLLSGGLDSITVLAIAKSQDYDCNCLSFNYGQRQKQEIKNAKSICRKMKVSNHLVLKLDLGSIGGSALTSETPVPKNRSSEEMAKEIPVTYVPARNIIFLAHALAWAEVIGVNDIFLGINAVDYSGYPDCRPEFLKSFAEMANLGTRSGAEGYPFRFHAPLINLSKKEIIRKGIELGVDYSMTHSCYDPVNNLACGRCDACRLRLKGFREAGLEDPIRYANMSGDNVS